MSTSSGDSMGVRASNWAIEGWKTTAGGGDAYVMEAAATGTTQLHHIAFINDVCFNSQMGFQGDDGALNHNFPGNGVDYFAFNGLIAQNCAQSGFGVAGINVVGVSPWDAASGTHIFVNGNFSIANQTTASGTDGESYMIDTLEAHGFAGTVVHSNNIGFGATRYGWELTYGGFNQSDVPTIKAYNNTMYGNNQNFTTSDNSNGEFNFNYNNSCSCSATVGNFVVSLTNNLGQTNKPSTNSEPIMGFNLGGVHWTSLTDTANFFNASATVCHGSPCFPTSAPFSATYFNSNTHSATDTYTTPSFTNPTDLMTNQTGVPTCTGFQTTTACMGYNAITSTLTTPSVISDLVPTASRTSGKGYQLPSITCAPNSDYPTWLKGVVYLHWNGKTITENSGLVSKPCGL